MRKKYLIPAIVCLGALLAAGSYVAAANIGLVPTPFTTICNNGFLASSMPTDKLIYLQAVCARMAQDAQAPHGAVDQPMPTPPISYGGMVYGVTVYNQAGPIPNVAWSNEYSFTSDWIGQSGRVMAGSLQGDPSQGVVVVVDNSGGYPTPIATYQTTSKDGALTLVSANGNSGNCVDNGLDKNCPPATPIGGDMLTLKAADGATYTFNVSSNTLSRQ